MNTTLPVFRGSPQYYEDVEQRELGQNQLDFLSLNLPPLCNFGCEICFSGMGSRRQFITNSLTAPEVRRLIDDAHDLGAFHVEISGEGEPFTYPGMVNEIVDHANRRDMHATIFTNGSLLDDETVRRLSGHDVSIAFSLNRADRESHDRFVRTPGSFDRVMRAIETTRRLFRRNLRTERNLTVHPVAIHTITSGGNRDDLERLARIAGDDIFFSVAPVMRRGNGHEAHIADDMDDLITEFSDGSIITSQQTRDSIGHAMCGTFNFGIGIRHNGDVMLDAHCYETAGHLGNVRSTPLEELVAAVRELRQQYYRCYDDGGFCPLRNERIDEFIGSITGTHASR